MRPSPSPVPKRTGIAHLPLHYGRMPRWLFERMVRLAREICCAVVAEEKPENILADLKRIKTLDLPPRHCLTGQDIHPDRLGGIFYLAHEHKPQSFEELIGLRGVGPKTLRALSLVSEMVHGVPASFRDPVRYSFAHGGKDGIPYPVDRETYDQTIELLSLALRRAKIGGRDRTEALRRLSRSPIP